MPNTRLIAISGSLLGIAICVAIFVISGMLGVLIQQRHREIALLRAIAATPRQIRHLIGAETLVLTLLGTIIGIRPGMCLAEVIIDGMRGQALLRHLPQLGRTDPGPGRARRGPVDRSRRHRHRWPARLEGAARRGPSRRRRPVPTVRLGPIRIVLGLLSLAGTAALFLVAMSFDAGIAQAVAPGLAMSAMVVVGLFAPWLSALGVRACLVSQKLSAAGYPATPEDACLRPTVGRRRDPARPHPGHRGHDDLPAEHPAGGRRPAAARQDVGRSSHQQRDRPARRSPARAASARSRYRPCPHHRACTPAATSTAIPPRS